MDTQDQSGMGVKMIVKVSALVPLVIAGLFFFFNRPQGIGTGETVNLTYESPLYTEEKGLIIVKVAFEVKTEDPAKVTINPLLPTPWQYLRKEINENGQGYIEAAYLTGSPEGYVIESKASIASITFPKKGKLELDMEKTTLMTKLGKQHPLLLRVTK